MALAAPSMDIESVLLSLERKLTTLEIFAKNKCNGGKDLPSLGKPRSFPNDKALQNAVDSSLLRLEKIADKLPKAGSTGKSHITAQIVDYDPGELFFKKVDPLMQQLLIAARGISKLKKDFGGAAAVIGQQADLLYTSVKAEAALVSRAAKMPKPATTAQLKAECEALVDASADTADCKEAVEVRSPLHDHALVLADAAAALGWVVAPVPLKHVRDYKDIVGSLTESILSRYIELGMNALHSDFAEALNGLLEAIVKYVEKEHPSGLRWNYASGSAPLGYRRAQNKVSKDAHPIGDFFGIMHGALTVFILRSRDIGGTVARIAPGVLSLYEEMQKAIESAGEKKRPVADGGGGELRMVLMSVQHELVPLVDNLQAISNKDPQFDELLALQEFVNVMQWCTATLHKMSPVTYLIDIESVTRRCLDRVDEKHAKDKTFKGDVHRQWVQSVRDMVTELKQYVRTHHPNELMFDTGRSRRSFDEMWKKKTLTNEILALRKKSKAKKWVPTRKTKLVRGKRKEVNAWRRL